MLGDVSRAARLRPEEPARESTTRTASWHANPELIEADGRDSTQYLKWNWKSSATWKPMNCIDHGLSKMQSVHLTAIVASCRLADPTRRMKNVSGQ